MKIFIVDISGKVIKYDIALCEAIDSSIQNDIEIEFYCPLYDEVPRCKTTKLFNLVPKKYKNGEYLWKRFFKLFELIFNYIFLICKVALKKPDIVHFQWFPLMEVCSVEHCVVKIMKLLSNQTQIVLTIHNVYPHTFIDKKKMAYAKRFLRFKPLINEYIVHTEETKAEVIRDFRIDEEKIKVVHHGIFSPRNFTPTKNVIDEQNVTFIMYGNLSEYKGVDIFVEAIKELPEQYKKKIHGVIAGEMQNKELCKKLQSESKDLNIDWYPYFLSDKELYERIDKANVIVLPYKSISQSGVLLLALFFRRYIITSDLTSFKETLHGFSDDMFFKSENPTSLAQLIIKYVDGKIDFERQMKVINNLNEKYSWVETAKNTIKAYKTVKNGSC